MIDLRKHQHDQIQRTRAELKHTKRVLLQGSTGIGKTRMAAYMMHGAATRDKTSYFVVHQSELWQQTSRSLTALGVHHGVIAAGVPATSSPIQVCSIQTLVNRLHDLPPPGMLVIDECHRAAADTYQHVTNWTGDSAYILGLTATPERTDGKGLGDTFDTIVKGAPMRWLIDNGFLCDYEIYSVPPSAELEAGNQYGDLVETYQKITPNMRCAVMCRTKKHAQDVAKAYRAAGIPATYIDGDLSRDERRAILHEFEHGTTRVLTSVNLMLEGVDIPNIEVIQWARNTDSLIIWLQGIGRGLRTHVTKGLLVILDNVGNLAKHGKPCDERHWSLGGAPARKRLEQGKDVYARMCESCHGHYNATKNVCPYCGATPTPQAREIVVTKGELVKMESAASKETLEVMKKMDGWRGVVQFAMMQGYDHPVMWAANRRGLGKPTPQIINEMQGYYDEITRNQPTS